jgi:hypothetical protein
MDRWVAVLHGDRRVVLRCADQWAVALRLAPEAVPQYAARAALAPP